MGCSSSIPKVHEIERRGADSLLHDDAISPYARLPEPPMITKPTKGILRRKCLENVDSSNFANEVIVPKPLSPSDHSTLVEHGMSTSDHSSPILLNSSVDSLKSSLFDREILEALQAWEDDCARRKDNEFREIMRSVMQ
jgi:hypothetical protein